MLLFIMLTNPEAICLSPKTAEELLEGATVSDLVKAGRVPGIFDAEFSDLYHNWDQIWRNGDIVFGRRVGFNQGPKICVIPYSEVKPEDFKAETIDGVEFYYPGPLENSVSINLTWDQALEVMSLRAKAVEGIKLSKISSALAREL